MRELQGLSPRALPADLLQSTAPWVARGLLAEWPAVRAARASAEQGLAYLRGFYRDATVGAWRGAPEIEGRFFYNQALDGFNFEAAREKLGAVLDDLLRHLADTQPPAIYVGSTTLDTCLPGFSAENPLSLDVPQPLTSIWIGNRTRIAAHHDVPDNLAAVVAGRRRFTLLAPDQVENLYIGPLDFTPAGQAISLVDFAHPDLARFPRFAQAQSQVQVVELDAGDALFIPSLWWHQVEALDSVNVLVNCWWRQSPAHMDSPMNALLMALLSVRDLPPAQRAAWQALFRHYVFEADAQGPPHIPAAAQGVLRPLDPGAARQLRARLLKSLNR